jgi:hypothetical protein
MSTVSVVAPTSSPSVLWRLTRIEAVRYAKHPLFLIGFALALASSGTYGPVELDHQVVPAFFLGVLGIIVANRLVTASDQPAAVVDAAPVSETVRTGALCLACLVPGAAGVVVVLVHRVFVLIDPPATYEYAGYDAAARFLITMAIPVVACVGGPLLGVVAGRWLRFPGAAVLTVLAVVMWSATSAYITQDIDPDSLAARVLHLMTPYTAFLETNADSNTAPTLVTAFTGSPFWFWVWTVALCGLAATAALLRGAEGAVRRTLLRCFAGVAAIAVTALVLGVTTGAQQLVYYTPDGWSSTVKPVPDDG